MVQKNKKILIVEDDENLFSLLMDKFNEEEFNVIGARNGVDGLDAALKEIPDLILLDIIMPKMDGIEMLKELKNNAKTKNIPVIMLTNLSDVSSGLAAFKHGASDYLVKTDWKLADLVKKVGEVLKKRN